MLSSLSSSHAAIIATIHRIEPSAVDLHAAVDRRAGVVAGGGPARFPIPPARRVGSRRGGAPDGPDRPPPRYKLSMGRRRTPKKRAPDIRTAPTLQRKCGGNTELPRDV